MFFILLQNCGIVNNYRKIIYLLKIANISSWEETLANGHGFNFV